jgi:hypothetical protein
MAFWHACDQGKDGNHREGGGQMGTPGVVGALQKESSGRPFKVRAQRRFESIMYVIAVIIWLGTMGFAVWMFWQSWTTGAWDNFWFGALSILPGFFLPARARDMDWKKRAYLADGARALRWAAAAGDDRFASQVSSQPGGQAEAEVPIGRCEVKIANPWVGLQWVLIVLLVVLGLVGIGGAGLGLWGGYMVATAPASHDPTSGWGPAIGIGIALMALLIGGAVAWLPLHFLPEAWSALRGQRFEIDEWSIRRISGGRQRANHSLAWHEFRAFFRIEERPFGDLDAELSQRMGTLSPQLRDSFQKAAQATSATYFLDGANCLLTWTLTRRATREDIAEHGRLCRLIATRTGLPMRDLTDQAIAVSRTAERAKKDSPPRAAVVSAYLGGGGVSLVSLSLAGAPGMRKVITRGPILSLLLIYGGGWGLQHFQTSQYGNLVAQIHAEKPLFSDSLTHDDGLWPVAAASNGDASYAFQHGGYWIADGWGEANATQTYGDVAVEVTLRQYPANYRTEKMGDLNEAGLILRGTNNPDSLVTFTIGPLGDWFLMRYRDWGPHAGQWQVLAFGEHSKVVKWGIGVRNHLLVDMRGSHYICFVNGQLIAAVTDNALTAGHVGVWVDDNTTEGLFNDFTVYPAV